MLGIPDPNEGKLCSVLATVSSKTSSRQVLSKPLLNCAFTDASDSFNVRNCQTIEDN